jgi:hypothetical protein
MPPISNKLKGLGVIFLGSLRPILWATGRTSAVVEALQAGGFVPLPRTNAGQSDAGLVEPARLGSPLALQRRAHPGDSGWIPARFGRLVHPRLYFPNYAFSLARASPNDGRRD